MPLCPPRAAPETAVDRAPWGDFHKYNTAGSHAFKLSAICQEYFRTLKQLEAKFTLGHGRAIDASVSNFLEEKNQRLAAMCGHRKMGYFSGAAIRCFEKYRGIYMAIAVRQLHAMEGRKVCFDFYNSQFMFVFLACFLYCSSTYVLFVLGLTTLLMKSSEVAGRPLYPSCCSSGKRTAMRLPLRLFWHYLQKWSRQCAR